MSSWPKTKPFAERFRVEDLVPRDVKPGEFRAVFIGESPHRDEVAPDSASERSPFRGVAGREWWSALSRYLKAPYDGKKVPPRSELLRLCSELRIAVMNAVQYPIDPKIELHQGEKSSPILQLGFHKATGEGSYKTVFKRGQKNPVTEAIDDLASRLRYFEDSDAALVCLGNDSRWFVEKALQKLGWERELVTIPHPSSWWRNAGYKSRAIDFLEQELGPAKA